MQPESNSPHAPQSVSPNYFILTEDATLTPGHPRTRVTRNSAQTGALSSITVNAPTAELNKWLQDEFNPNANLPALHNAFPELTEADNHFILYGLTNDDHHIEDEKAAYARAAQQMRILEYRAQ